MTDTFISHSSCLKCGSSDALALYSKDNGSIYGKCFACHKISYNITNYTKKAIKMVETKTNIHEINTYPFADKTERKITNETVKYFGIRASINSTTGEQESHYYPYYIGKDLTGFKVRQLPKHFYSVGHLSGSNLFGQHLCTAGSLKLIITEGEEDALAAYQILKNYCLRKNIKKEPQVVSLSNGINSAATELEKHMKFIDSYKEIILCFDQDKAGQKGISVVTSLLTTKNIKTMSFSEKDASDMLTTGKEDEFLSAFYKAEKWKPDSIINISDTWDLLINKKKVDSVSYPSTWNQLNTMCYGRRLGELDTWTAGSGSGKTQIFRELQYNDLLTTEYPIGIMSLEEPIEDTLDGLVGLHLNKRIHLPDIRLSVGIDEIKTAHDFLSLNKKVYFYNHFGSTDDFSLLSKIRYFAAGLGCKLIYLDHLSLVISEQATAGDERQRIDSLMTKLKMLTQELNIWIGLIVHLRKTSGQTPFELGSIPDEDSLRGSGSIKQLSNGVFAVQRNKRHTDMNMRDVLKIHVLKNRFTGREGGADYLRFNQITGRLEKINEPPFPILEPKKKSENNY